MGSAGLAADGRRAPGARVLLVTRSLSTFTFLQRDVGLKPLEVARKPNNLCEAHKRYAVIRREHHRSEGAGFHSPPDGSHFGPTVKAEVLSAVRLRRNSYQRILIGRNLSVFE